MKNYQQLSTDCYTNICALVYIVYWTVDTVSETMGVVSADFPAKNSEQHINN